MLSLEQMGTSIISRSWEDWRHVHCVANQEVLLVCRSSLMAFCCWLAFVFCFYLCCIRVGVSDGIGVAVYVCYLHYYVVIL